MLKNGKLLAKERDGRLYVLFEADETNAALAPMAGKKLRIGLKLLNPYFSNFSKLNFDADVTTLFYRNATTATSLDAPQELALGGPMFRHTLLNPAQPMTVTLTNAAGQTAQTDIITAAPPRGTVSYNLTGQAPGAYVVKETYPDTAKTTTYYVDAELRLLGIFGIIEITLDSGFYTAAAAFELAFDAKDDILKYYVIAGHYSEAEFAQLSVADAGFSEDQRPEVKFTKVASSDFTGAEISPDLLSGVDLQVALFKSQAAVPRQEKARRNIQLSKNGDVLITHLPQVGADKLDGNIIIHLSKP